METKYKISYDFNVNPRCGPRNTILYLIQHNGIPKTYIEIGLLEGSTFFWMSDLMYQLYPQAAIYGIDPHVGSDDIHDDFTMFSDNFNYNLSVHNNPNCEYIKKKSEDGLLDLINRGVSSDLIYIDGDHKSNTVLTDLVLSFKLLTVGGIIVCDDTMTWKYHDKNGKAAVQDSPRLAVESFIACNWSNIEPIAIPNSGQTAFRKIC